MNEEAAKAVNDLIVEVSKNEQTKTNPDLLRELNGLVGTMVFHNRQRVLLTKSKRLSYAYL